LTTVFEKVVLIGIVVGMVVGATTNRSAGCERAQSREAASL
jgi:hypothetical protein